MAEAVMENILAVGAHAMELDISRLQEFFPKHVRNLHRYGRWTRWRGELVLAGNEVAFALGDVGQRDIEDVAVVGAVEHDAVDHGAPVVDLRREDAGLLLEPFEDAGRDEVLDRDPPA
jgi:hypothetical protein